MRGFAASPGANFSGVEEFMDTSEDVAAPPGTQKVQLMVHAHSCPAASTSKTRSQAGSQSKVRSAWEAVKNDAIQSRVLTQTPHQDPRINFVCFSWTVVL